MPYLRKVFEGRMSRSDYWVGTLFFPMFLLVLLFVLLFLFPQGIDPTFTEPLNMFEIIIIILAYISLIPFSVRRLHDLNKPGSNLIFALIPLYNIFFGLELMLATGTKEKNNYGEVPHDQSIIYKLKRIFGLI